MRLRLPDLHCNDDQARKLRAAKLLERWENIEGMLQYRGFSYFPKIIWLELISRHHDDFLAGHFELDKTRKLIARKYYWPTLRQNVKAYVKGCNICLASKVVWHKLYRNLQALPISTYRWKDLSMDFMTGLPVLTDWKSKSYDSILVIIDRFTKIMHYKPVKITIDATDLAEVIIDVMVRHYDLPDSIITDWGSLFMSKFWFSLCYFLEIKRRLFTAFHPKTDGQTERQNNIMEAYLRAFVNWEQNNWVHLLPMAEFAYNNTMNASTNHMPFELNCGFHLQVSFKDNVIPYSRSRSTNELAK